MAKQPNRHICLYSCLRRVEHGHTTVYLQQVIRVKVQWPNGQHWSGSALWFEHWLGLSDCVLGEDLFPLQPDV